MSSTFTLRSTSHVLTANYYPPIELDEGYDYALGVIGLHTYNTIPNVYAGNNKFYYGDDKVIVIPDGAYEICDLESFIQKKLSTKVSKESDEKDKIISIKANNNTLQCEIKSEFPIDFTPHDSIGRMLGFSSRVLSANEIHESDLPVQIIKVVTIRIECNIVTSAYYDAHISHTLFEFAPSVEPGYSINIEPRNIVYLPVNTRKISNITLRLLDQDGDPVDFRGEPIVIRLELKRWV